MKLKALVAEPVTANQINLAATSNLSNVITWSTPVTVNITQGAGGTITVTHDLGTVPNVIRIESWIDCRWWADADDRRVWSATTVTFHVSAPDGQLTVQAGVW